MYMGSLRRARHVTIEMEDYKRWNITLTHGRSIVIIVGQYLHVVEQRRFYMESAGKESKFFELVVFDNQFIHVLYTNITNPD